MSASNSEHSSRDSLSEDPASPSRRRLEPRDIEDLRRSGLSDDTIAASGFFTVAGNVMARALGFHPATSGMAIPYLGTKPILVRFKLHEPFKGRDGKSARYVSPKKERYPAGNRLYIPPTLHPSAVSDPGVALIVTEGEKKALKAVQEGFPTIAVSGVTAWRNRAPDGTSKPISDLDKIAWKGRRVCIAYDSDVMTKSAVAAQLRGLTTELTRRGAIVFQVILPALPQETEEE